jgi:hypothetical protein
VFAIVAILAVSRASAQHGDVRRGMTTEQVTLLLGEPDRKAVLIGKVLRDADQFSAEDLARLRLVYIYDLSGLRVWFLDNTVTGVTRDGVSLN